MSEYTLQCRGVGKYAYVAQADDELSFEEGDPISVWSIDDSGWWYATNERTLEYGFIPESYFERDDDVGNAEDGTVVEQADHAIQELAQNDEQVAESEPESSAVEGLGAERASVPAVVKRSRAASLARQSSSASSTTSTSALDSINR